MSQGEAGAPERRGQASRPAGPWDSAAEGSPTLATREPIAPGHTHPAAASATRAAPCAGRGGGGGSQWVRRGRAASWRLQVCARCAGRFLA